ncbi:MAG TPA: hypothetical protein DCS93_13800 [Microscillaceae bacterium]|nr:hypothetical protein [Microscillaceae bacterium]
MTGYAELVGQRFEEAKEFLVTQNQDDYVLGHKFKNTDFSAFAYIGNKDKPDFDEASNWEYLGPVACKVIDFTNPNSIVFHWFYRFSIQDFDIVEKEKLPENIILE